MADANPSRVGQINLAGDPKAIFLKVFGGEVLTHFGRTSAFKDRMMTRTISSGKSASFPAIGIAQASYHTPGQEITGQNIASGERIIVIDDMIIAPVFIPNIDEAMVHFDVRSPYSTEIGQALAKLYDQNAARAYIKAARDQATITGLEGGGFSENAGYDNDGSVLWKGIFNAGVALDTKDVPSDDRYAFLRPVQYALVVQSEKPIDTRLNAERDNGSLQEGVVKMVNGIPIIKTNNLVQADDRTNAKVNAGLRGDYSVTRGIVGHKSAAGAVQLQGVALESAYDIRRQGTLMVGKYLVGQGQLRPESAYELRTGAPAA
jgi:hypothetical protein